MLDMDKVAAHIATLVKERQYRGRQSREYPGSTAYSTERKEEILRAYQERSSLRGLERTFGVARSTVISWLKKSPAARSTNTDAHSSSSARSTHDHTRTG
jgi:transposase-like protein